jgi:hypothetical protein
MFDRAKHANPFEAIQFELSEEARLKGGEWTCLLDPASEGIPDLKMSVNRYTCYLVVDPVEDVDAKERDAEEYIEIERMTFDRAKELVMMGMVLPTAVTVLFMAMNKLDLIRS